MIRTAILGGLLAALPVGAMAHQMVVFASVDCEAVTVEAKFSNGNAVQQADVRVLDGVMVPRDSVDHSGGLVIEVDTGSHDNYWIVTPEDIAKSCQS